jgi:hypothetical protein
MQLIAILVAVAIIVAVVFWRFLREPRWAGVLRFTVAVIIAWNVLASWESDARWHRMHERATAGDSHAHDYDTGGGTAMILVGWIPASAFVGLLVGVRWSIIRFRRHDRASA